MCSGSKLKSDCVIVFANLTQTYICLGRGTAPLGWPGVPSMRHIFDCPVHCGRGHSQVSKCKKGTEHVMENKPVSRIPPGSLVQFLLQVPTLSFHLGFPQ